MSILERYIGRAVGGSMLLVLVILLAIYTFAALVNELDKVGRGQYDLWAAFQFVLLTLPRRISELFPACALLGTMLGLGSLASSSELTAIRAAGVSMVRITYAVMKMGALLMLAAYLIGDQLAPVAEQIAQRQRAVALGKQLGIHSGLGFWARDGDNFINIRRLYPGGRVEHVNIYEFAEDRQLRQVTMAASAAYEDRFWTMSDIRIASIDPERVTVARKDSIRWPFLLSPELLNVVLVDVKDLSARELWGYVEYLKDNELEATHYETAFWDKLMAPLTTGVMVFVAIPFVFGPLRSVSMGQRILVGAMLGMGFHIFDAAFQSYGEVARLPPLLNVTLPTALFLGLGLVMMRRVR